MKVYGAEIFNHTDIQTYYMVSLEEITKSDVGSDEELNSVYEYESDFGGDANDYVFDKEGMVYVGLNANRPVNLKRTRKVFERFS